MTVWLVRHASAGSRKAWPGADSDRPLDGKGRRQAARLADLLEKVPARQVLSSPYRRCVETVTPLAETLGVGVEPADALAEGQAPGATKLLASHTGTDAVFCTHGDIVPALLEWVGKQGARVSQEARWSKGSTWVLEAKRGRYVSAHYLPPPG